MATDWLGGNRPSVAADLKFGEGKVIIRDGNRVACFRDENGELSEVSQSVLISVASYIGIRPNGLGIARVTVRDSRFDSKGAVLAGPAETPLSPIASKESQLVGPSES